MKSKISFGLVLFSHLFFISLAFAGRGGVSGGGGEDGRGAAELISDDNDKYIVRCPNQGNYNCDLCESAITPHGEIDQEKLNQICDLMSL